MIKRLTKQQIVDKYPDQWVGLTDCEYDGSTLLSGIVTYTGLSQDELMKMQFIDKICVAFYTTEEALPIGAIGEAYVG